MKMGDPQSWQRQKMMQTHHQQTLWVYWSLVITFSVLAMGEPLRLLRFFNVFFGITLALAPFFFETNLLLSVSMMGFGGLLMALSVPRGVVYQRFAAWDKMIR